MGNRNRSFGYDDSGDSALKKQVSNLNCWVNNLMKDVKNSLIIPPGATDKQVLTWSESEQKLVWSNIEGSTELPPLPPSELFASVSGPYQINLTWVDNSPNESSFEIERSFNGTFWTALATVPSNTTSFQSKDLLVSTQYFYRIRSVNNKGLSDWSNVANATTDAPVVGPNAYSGWKDDSVMITEGDILQLNNKFEFVDQGVVSVDFSGSTIPRFLFMVEPVDQPVKTEWYVNELNKDFIFEGGTFNTPVVVGSFRVYMTSFKTKFNSPVRFKHNND